MLKKLIITLLSILSLSIFAGPEERKNNNCFMTSGEVLPQVSTVICYEGLKLDVLSKVVRPGASDFMPEFKVTEFGVTRDDEDKVKAEATLIDWTGSVCGESLVVKAYLSATFELNGTAQEDSVKLVLESETMNDWCHSTPNYTTVEYKRVN